MLMQVEIMKISVKCQTMIKLVKKVKDKVNHFIKENDFFK